MLMGATGLSLDFSHFRHPFFLFKDSVMDETGCGDTYLACTVCELLRLRQRSANQRDTEWGPEVLALPHCFILLSPVWFLLPLIKTSAVGKVVEAARVGSAAASFLVQAVGPDGFASRAVRFLSASFIVRISILMNSLPQEIERRVQSGTVQGEADSRKSITTYTPSMRKRQSLGSSGPPIEEGSGV